MTIQLIDEDITRAIIGAFYRVYNTLGFGFLESIYVAALDVELQKHGRKVGREVQIRVRYQDREVGLHRLDMLVDDRVIVEVKACAEIPKASTRQVYNYLRATNLEVGLLLHFGHEPRFYRCLNPIAKAVDLSAVTG